MWYSVTSIIRTFFFEPENTKRLQKDAIYGHFEVVVLLGLERLKYRWKEFIVTVYG